MPSSPLTATAEGVVVTIRVTPRARREGVDGATEIAGPRGPKTALAVRVAAPPADGAANAAVLRLLSRAWDVPQSTLTLVSGASGRLKRVLVRGDAATLLQHIASRIAA
jgi:uncharacterized protein (TIGR00251 family)